MKITTQHFESLRAAIEPKMHEYPRHAYKQLSDERYRWGLLHASGFRTQRLYEYLNDSHIDTALRKIIEQKQ